MALTNQPYLPLYVDDWMNNTKLKQCSAGAHGVMIAVMCLMHKEDTYGSVLLDQIYNQSDNQVKNFASFLARVTPFTLLESEHGLKELLHWKILKLDGNVLICERMVRDGELSRLRSKIGASGGKKTQKKIREKSPF